VVRGNIDDIERLVLEGEDVNERDAFGRTPLMVAVYRHDVAVARALIRLGADVNALDDQSFDTLTAAAVTDDLPMLQLLLSSGANARAYVGPLGGTALAAAAKAGRSEVVTALIAARAPLDHVNQIGETALIACIVHGDGGPAMQSVVHALVAAGADAGLADKQGATPLALARARGYDRIAAILQQAPARPDPAQRNAP
jgi:ankyrin repeat protein